MSSRPSLVAIPARSNMDDSEGIKVFAVFGFKKTRKDGAVVSITIDGQEVSNGSGGTQFISNPAFRGRESWWAFTRELYEGQVIKLRTTAWVPGRGHDTDRTTEQWYTVNPDYPMVEIRLPKIGYKKYPLLKGKLQMISATTEQEATDAKIESMLEEIEE